MHVASCFRRLESDGRAVALTASLSLESRRGELNPRPAPYQGAVAGLLA